jgi:subtilisin family serine protease
MSKHVLSCTLVTGALALAACVENAPISPAENTASRIAAPSLQVAAASSVELIPGQYLVMFKGNGVPASFAADVASRGGTVVASHDIGIAVVSGISADAATALGSRKDVQTFEQDALTYLDPSDIEVEAVADELASPASPSGASRYARQWNMRAIHADVAWAGGNLGASSVTLAILDTGIDYLWPDLNGRVDLSRSVSFIPSDDAVTAALFPGRHFVTDLHFHGTHVASTAVSNSNIVAGVTTATTLIGVKVCSRLGSCPSSAVLNGILWATDHGADVINMSLGGGFNKHLAGGFGSVINRVFNYANRNGTLVVVAAGNEASDLDHNGDIYKTYCDSPNVVCVSATGPTASSGVNGPWVNVDAPASYSNFGRSAISVAAPGGTGAGLVWAGCSQTTTITSLLVCRTGIFIVSSAGTSMATPHVAGLAASIKASSGGTPAQLRAALQQSADDLGQPGTDPFYGKGRINAARAFGLE